MGRWRRPPNVYTFTLIRIAARGNQDSRRTFFLCERPPPFCSELGSHRLEKCHGAALLSPIDGRGWERNRANSCRQESTFTLSPTHPPSRGRGLKHRSIYLDSRILGARFSPIPSGVCRANLFSSSEVLEHPLQLIGGFGEHPLQLVGALGEHQLQPLSPCGRGVGERGTRAMRAIGYGRRRVRAMSTVATANACAILSRGIRLSHQGERLIASCPSIAPDNFR